MTRPKVKGWVRVGKPNEMDWKASEPLFSPLKRISPATSQQGGLVQVVRDLRGAEI